MLLQAAECTKETSTSKFEKVRHAEGWGGVEWVLEPNSLSPVKFKYELVIPNLIHTVNTSFAEGRASQEDVRWYSVLFQT